MSDIAVLVLNWNGRRWLEPCFNALQQQTELDFETWLVDNGSHDDSVELVQARFPWVRTLELGQNLGFGAAYNRAIQVVHAPHIVLLNNDTIVQPGWLEALVHEMRAHPETAAVGSKLLYLDQPTIINHAGGRLTPLGAAFDVAFGCVDAPDFDRIRTVGCVTGAAMLVRRDALLQVGAFDERYFAYFEDADLCWRFWLRGYTVRYQPGARVLHAYGGSTGSGRESTFRIRHCQTNRLQNMLKHLEPTTLAWALPASLAYDAMKVVDYLTSARPRAAIAVAHGTRAFLRLVPDLLAERSRIQRTRMLSDAALFHLGVLATLPEAAREWRRLTRLGAHG